MTPNPTAILALLCALGAGCVTSRPPAPAERMVSLHGDSEVFSSSGRKTFPNAKAQCFDAVARTFKNTGHGIEKADLESGALVSGKATVYRAATTGANGTVINRTEDTKLYVRVTGSDSMCDVAVVKIRSWRNSLEAETARESWISAHLHAFMTGVEQELNEGS